MMTMTEQAQTGQKHLHDNRRRPMNSQDNYGYQKCFFDATDTSQPKALPFLQRLISLIISVFLVPLFTMTLTM